MARKMNKNDKVRAQVSDMIVKAFKNELVGVLDKKVRIEVPNAEGEIVQFAISFTMSKTPVVAEDCDDYVTLEEKLAAEEEVDNEKKKDEINFEDAPRKEESETKSILKEQSVKEIDSTDEDATIKKLMGELNID